jgi:hypothetical protein
MRRYTALTFVLRSAVPFLLGALPTRDTARLPVAAMVRQPVLTAADFQRVIFAARSGDALAFSGYDPSLGQRGFVIATVDRR